MSSRTVRYTAGEIGRVRVIEDFLPPPADLVPRARNAQQYYETGWTEGAALMRYAVVIEKADGNYSAYVPDLPGCVATGETVAAVETEIREAVHFHIELRADGLPIPAPTSIADYVEA